jgi:hypothetical protein
VDIRVIINQSPRAACDSSEFMLSAYCADSIGVLRILGTNGAACEGDPSAKAVVVCVRK